LPIRPRGGAFDTDKDKIRGLGVPGNRIYICNNIFGETELDQIDTVVHELAHFVSGQPLLIDDLADAGSMLTPSEKATLDRLRPEQKVRSAPHYAFFAMLAGFPQIKTTTT
jgi:hypothetical protein